MGLEISFFIYLRISLCGSSVMCLLAEQIWDDFLRSGHFLKYNCRVEKVL